MMIFWGVVSSYFLFVSLNYFILRMELSLVGMSQDDFKISLFFMWLPAINVFGLLINMAGLLIAVHNMQKQKRIKTNQPSFHERLFSIQKVNGRYEKRKSV